jgi:hypothetical protein
MVADVVTLAQLATVLKAFGGPKAAIEGSSKPAIEND